MGQKASLRDGLGCTHNPRQFLAVLGKGVAKPICDASVGLLFSCVRDKVKIFDCMLEKVQIKKCEVRNRQTGRSGLYLGL